MQPLENPEQVARVVRVESYAIVLHKKRPLISRLTRSETDPRYLAPDGELARIVKQVLEHDLQQPQIPVNLLSRFYRDLNVALRSPLADPPQHAVRQFREIHRFAPQFHPGHAAQLEQIIDQPGHAYRARLYSFKVSAAGSVKFVKVLVMEQSGKP